MQKVQTSPMRSRPKHVILEAITLAAGLGIATTILWHMFDFGRQLF